HAAAKALEAIVAGKVPVPAAAPAPAAVAAPAGPGQADTLPNVEAVLTAGDVPAGVPAEESAKPVLEVAADAAAEDFAEAGQPANPDPVTAQPAPAPKAPPKPIVAMRGDDRPGARRPEAAPAGRGGKFGDRKDSRGAGGKPGGPRQSTDNKFEPYRADREERGPRGADRNARPAFEERGPRLGDAAFRAQREAFEAANMALKKLAMQAHGEVLTNLLTAWEKRDPEQLPSAQDLGKVVTPAVRSSWVKAVSTPSGKDASEALLRMEIAAELPTPAEHISARRMLQLQLLTKRNAPAPLDTWGEDAAQVLAGDFDAAKARRVQNALKALLKR
ncbi:MAG: DUF349 domain-containing protein, partial [Pseudomonadota bacterium]